MDLETKNGVYRSVCFVLKIEFTGRVEIAIVFNFVVRTHSGFVCT